MTEKEMLDSLNNVLENLSHYGNKEMYEKMLLVVSNIHDFLTYDLELDLIGAIKKHQPPLLVEKGAFDFE